MRVTQPQARGRQGCCGQQTLRGRQGPPGPLEGAWPLTQTPASAVRTHFCGVRPRGLWHTVTAAQDGGAHQQQDGANSERLRRQRTSRSPGHKRKPNAWY